MKLILKIRQKQKQKQKKNKKKITIIEEQVVEDSFSKKVHDALWKRITQGPQKHPIFGDYR